jgi:hypothetical protein
MLHYVAVLITDVSEKVSASIIRVTRIGELGTLAVTSTNACYEEIQCTRATRRNIPEDAILHSHCCENLKSYKLVPVGADHIHFSECLVDIPLDLFPDAVSRALNGRFWW